MEFNYEEKKKWIFPSESEPVGRAHSLLQSLLHTLISESLHLPTVCLHLHLHAINGRKLRRHFLYTLIYQKAYNATFSVSFNSTLILWCMSPSTLKGWNIEVLTSSTKSKGVILPLLITCDYISTEEEWGTWKTILHDFLLSQLEVPRIIQEKKMFILI